MLRHLSRVAVLAIPAALLLMSARPALAQGDPETIERIIREGKDNSKVWVYLSFLAEEIGPRLTGSTRLERANNWTRDMFESFGCSNAQLYKWGEIPVRFDRGPSYARITAPVARELVFTTRSWSAGTDGPVKGRVVKQPETLEELEKMKDQLKGAWVLAKPPAARGGGRGGPGGPGGPGAATRPGAPEGSRAQGRAAAPAGGGGGAGPQGRPGGAGGGGAGGQPTTRPAGRGEELLAQDEVIPAMWEAGIAGRITPSSNELVLTGGERGWREMDFEKLPTQPSIIIPRSDYDSLNSRLADGEQIEIEVNLDHRFEKGPIPVYNTIAEIPGTEFPEQVVIVSAHLDSWDGPGAQGAQDNGTGSSVTLETARILMAAGVKPRRTIRFVLWTGEEQGLLGSRAYLEQMSEADRAQISAAFVDDGGTNYQGGLVCVESMAAMLRTATEPVNRAFRTMPVEIIVQENMPRGGGSDHASFNRLGIPGFFWREDGTGGREGRNYQYIHHTQHDTTRYAVPEYLIQSATCSAVTVYNLAMADTMLPRAPVPTTQQASEGPGFGGPFTAAPGPLTGTWTADMTMNGEVMPAAFTFTLEHSSEGRMRGYMFSRYGEGRLRRVQYNPESGELTFMFNTEMGGNVQYRATVKGEDVSGNLSSEDAGFTMPFTAKKTSEEVRQPAEAPAQPGNPPAGGGRAGAANAGS